MNTLVMLQIVFNDCSTVEDVTRSIEKNMHYYDYNVANHRNEIGRLPDRVLGIARQNLDSDLGEMFYLGAIEAGAKTSYISDGKDSEFIGLLGIRMDEILEPKRRFDFERGC